MYESYSDALVDHGGVWTGENLAAFIRNPEGFAPGTSMPSAEIDIDDLVDALVLFLKESDKAF